MPTTGDRGTKRSWRLIAFTAIAGGLTAFALGAGGESQALSPPPADKAEIIYSNGGRIVQINADGSDRKVLTNRGRVLVPGVVNGPLGDRLPRVSPDGTRVLFTRFNGREIPENEFLRNGASLVFDRTRGTIRDVLPKQGQTQYLNLAWIPGTERVLAAKISARTVRKSSVVSVGLDGSNERTILRFRDYFGGFPRKNRHFEASRLEVSPDGSKFLMTRMDSWSNAGYALELVDMESGKRTLVADKAHSGSWSPDGSRIVFVKDQPDEEVCDWDFDDCTPRGDLYVADGSGQKVRKLLGTPRDEASPTWSPDGTRIVFSGTMVHPDQRASAEIFSIDSDGSCLVGLTNGSPASQHPDFVPGSGELQGPFYCGLKERPALAEGHLNPRMNKGLGKRLWAGPQSSQGLLSADADIGFLSFASYSDCGTYKSKDCPPGVSVITWPVCSEEGDWARNVAYLLDHRQKRRGVWIREFRGNDLKQVMVYSGPQITMVSNFDPNGQSETTNITRKELLKLVGELRPLGEKLKPRLPGLVLPRMDYRISRQMTRFVRRHSIPAAMKQYRMERDEVVDSLSFRTNAKRLGVVKRIKCPRSLSL